jgi:hypothetical protein
MFFRMKVYATSNSISIKSSTHQWKQWHIEIHNIPQHFESSYLNNETCSYHAWYIAIVVLSCSFEWKYSQHLIPSQSKVRPTNENSDLSKCATFRTIISPQRIMFISRLIRRYCFIVVIFRMKVFPTSNSISIKSSTHEWKRSVSHYHDTQGIVWVSSTIRSSCRIFLGTY